MRNPDDRSPQEWAEELRQDAASLRLGGSMEKWPEDCDELAERMDDLEEALRLLRDEPDVRHIVSYLTAADCDELTARMDDLTEALRIIKRLSPSEPLHMDEDVRALLAKYEEEVDSE